MEFDFGGAVLTSVSSYTDRDILVTRDASQLTGSVTYYNLGGDGDEVRAQFAAARLHDGRGVHAGAAPHLRLRGPLPVGARRLLQRHRAQLRPDAADAGLRRAHRRRRGSSGSARRSDTPFFSHIPYDFEQTASFAEGSFDITERLSRDGRRALLRLLRRTASCISAACSPTATACRPSRATARRVGRRRRAAARAARVRRLGQRAAERAGFRGLPARRHQRPAEPGPVLARGPRSPSAAATASTSEELWNYELGAKIGFADGRGQFNIAAFHAEIDDLQMPVVAGTCSSRIVINVPGRIRPASSSS